MKKFIVVLTILFLIAGFVCVAQGGRTEEQAQYLRVHIRANSNCERDQSVKYLVRDGIVRLLTPVVAECESKEAAIGRIGGLLPDIEKEAESLLRENGFSYGARATLKREKFPTRVYEGITLEEGVYDALIIELGEGGGDNWWCVVYPPLCFTSGSGNVVYRSKIMEIIRAFFA